MSRHTLKRLRLEALSKYQQTFDVSHRSILATTALLSPIHIRVSPLLLVHIHPRTPSHAPKATRYMESSNGAKETPKSANRSEDVTLVEILELRRADTVPKSIEKDRNAQPKELEDDGEDDDYSPPKKRRRPGDRDVHSRKVIETRSSKQSLPKVPPPNRSSNSSSSEERLLPVEADVYSRKTAETPSSKQTVSKLHPQNGSPNPSSSLRKRLLPGEPEIHSRKAAETPSSKNPPNVSQNPSSSSSGKRPPQREPNVHSRKNAETPSSKQTAPKLHPQNGSQDPSSSSLRKRPLPVEPDVHSRKIAETPSLKQTAPKLHPPKKSPNPPSPTLQVASQKGRKTLTIPSENSETQDIFWDATQQAPNFDLPLPPGGWDEEDSLSNNAYIEDFETAPTGLEEYNGALSNRAKPSQASQATIANQQDTQALFAADTQLIETTLAPPPGGWSDEEDENENTIVSANSSHPQPNPKATKENKSNTTEILTLESWIQQQTLHPRRPAPESLVLEALKRTTLSLPLASLVVAKLQSGQSVPENRKGIWTEDDDRRLESADARALMSLEKKHGSAAVDERVKFLEDWRR